MRHEYASAKEDLERVKDLEPWNAEAEEELRKLRKAVEKSKVEQKKFYGGIFQQA